MGLRRGSGDEKMGEQQGYVNFEELKAEVPLQAILSFYDVLEGLEEYGGELVGHCPFCDHQAKKKPFHANLDKNVWQCFACKRKGSIIDFVKHKEGGTLKEAAQFIQMMIASRSSQKARSDRVLASERLREEPDGEVSRWEKQPQEELPSVLSLDQANRLVVNGQAQAREFVVLHIANVLQMVQEADRETVQTIRGGRSGSREGRRA
jgi:DNA primase